MKMSKRKLTYKDFKEYFSNNLPNKDKHSFEKGMMQDSFEEDAFEGLSKLSNDELEEDIRNDNVIINNKFFVQEAYTFIYDERNRPVAMGKHSRGTEEEDLLDEENTYTDDSILSEAITNFIRKGKMTTTVVVPV